MKKGSLLFVLLLYFSFADAQRFVAGGILKSEIKPRTTGQQVPVPPVNPNDFTKFSAEVWPNPAIGNFNLKVESPSDEELKVYLNDFTGKRIMKFGIINKETVLFGEVLSPGLYFIQVYQGRELRSTLKVIKQ